MTIETIKVKIDEKDETVFSLHNLFQRMNSIEIPPFQREYVWGVNNVELLIKDFDELNGEDDTHFMGVIIDKYSNTDKMPMLLDGQQRIITALCAFSAAVETIESEFIPKINSLAENIVKCSGKDQINVNLSFKNLEKVVADSCISVLALCDDDFRNDGFIVSNKTVDNAYKNIKKTFSKFYERFKDRGDEYTINFIKNLFEKSRFIYLRTGSITEAFSLFESLNSRGKALRANEMIKNYYYHRTLKKNKTDFETKWNNITVTLNKCGMGNHEKFLQVFWNCICTEINDKVPRDLYEGYKTLITKKDGKKVLEPYDVTKLMEEASIIFRSLFDEEFNFKEKKFMKKYTDEEKEKIIKHVEMLRIFNYKRVVSSVYMAAMLNKVNFSDLDKILSALEAICVRDLWVKNLKISIVTNYMDNIARKISISKSYEGIMDKSPSDSGIEGDFEIKELKVGSRNSSDSTKLKMFFYCLFDKDDLTKLDKNMKNNHVEHICPQNPLKCDIENCLEDDFRSHFGNLTVLEKPINVKIKNECYSTKNEEYQASSYYFVRALEKIIQSNGDETMYDIKTLMEKSKEPVKFDGRVCWNKDRCEIWSNYLYNMMIRRWPVVKGKIIDQKEK